MIAGSATYVTSIALDDINALALDTGARTEYLEDSIKLPIVRAVQRRRGQQIGLPNLYTIGAGQGDEFLKPVAQQIPP